MPSVSQKQHNFFEAIAHDPQFAKKAGIPQSVGQDFSEADKGKDLSKLPKKKTVKDNMKALYGSLEKGNK